MVLKVTQPIPEGYFFTTPNEQELEMLPKMKTRVDFGIIPQTQVKGRAYVDVNRNFTFDEGDVPVPAVQIALDSGEFTVTSAQGIYSILRIHPGPNRVRVIIQSIPSGYRTSTPIEKKFEGKPGDLMTFDVAMTAERSVSGHVFLDKNDNGGFDSGERGISGVVISMNGRKVTTTQDGKFSVRDLHPGEKTLRIETSTLPKGVESKVASLNMDVPAGVFEKTDLNFPLRRKQSDESKGEGKMEDDVKESKAGGSAG